MSCLIAYMASDPDGVAAALQDHRELLQSGALSASPGAESVVGWGVGFYQGGEVLLQRRPRAPQLPVDLFGAVSGLRTDVFLAQVLPPATGKVAKSENTPPYRFRNWIMAHRSSGPGLDAVRDELLRQTPDFLRRNIRGQTDTELLFHLFLASLHEAGRGQLEDPNLPPELAQKALAAALSRVRALQPQAEGTSLQVAASNGRSLVYARCGAEPVWLLHLRAANQKEDHGQHFRGLLALAGTLRPPGAADELPAEHAVLLGRDLQPRVVPLG